MSNRRATLAVPKLRSASVLGRLKAEAPSRIGRVDFGEGQPVEFGNIGDILYVPALHLQIWREAFVPSEANTDEDAFRELHRRSRNGQIMAHALFTNVPELNDDVCVLSNMYSHNFYHFVEELYKVITLERAGFTGKYAFSQYPSRIAPGLPSFSLELLELLAVTRDRIVHLGGPTLLHSAWYTTRISHADTIAYRGAFLALRDALMSGVGDRDGLGPRLWLQRRTSRFLVNEDEVHACIGRHGFAIVDMADLPASQQIAAARAARVVAGPHGAALVHCMFMPEHSTVIECFSPRFINPSVLELCGHLNHSYFQLVQINSPASPYKSLGNVEVNCRHLELTLKSLGPG